MELLCVSMGAENKISDIAASRAEKFSMRRYWKVVLNNIGKAWLSYETFAEILIRL